MRQERRVRHIRISCGDVLDWFTMATKGLPGCIHVPLIEGLPEDARVYDVQNDFYSNSFLFLIGSDSFDEVPEGERVPYFEGSFPRKYIAVNVQPETNSVQPEPDSVVFASAPKGVISTLKGEP